MRIITHFTCRDNKRTRYFNVFCNRHEQTEQLCLHKYWINPDVVYNNNKSDETATGDLPFVFNNTLLLCPPERLRSIVMSTSVCVPDSLSVREDISGTTCAIFTNFCAGCLWSWLGPTPELLRYDMYFRFCGPVRLHTAGEV